MLSFYLFISDTAENVQTPMVPPNSRAPSPHTVIEHEQRLPYADPIPQEYVEISAPWVEVHIYTCIGIFYFTVGCVSNDQFKKT